MDSNMYRAAMEGKVEALSQSRGQFMIQLTPNKNTILHIAALYGKTECVSEILKHSPMLLNRVNVKGETPLHFAAREGHLAIVEAIVERAKEMDREERERGVEVGKEILRTMNEDGDTALHEAVQNRRLDVVKLLVNEDPEFVYTENNSGESPLYIAVEKGLDGCVAEILMTCGGSPTYGGPFGRTALHAAVIFNSEESTKKLMYWKRDLSKEADKYGWAPLHYAARLGRVERVDQMLQFDKSLAYITTDDDDKKTALHIAAAAGHLEVTKVLILMCPDCCEMVNFRGQNILHLSIINTKEKVIRFVLGSPFVNSLINQKDMDGNTSLHLLAAADIYGNDIIAHPRAETMVFNNDNLNPLDIACSDKYVQGWPHMIRRKLKKVGANGQRILITRDEDEKESRKKATPEHSIQDVRNIGNTYLIVAVLIATITFAAGFTLPGGYDDSGKNQGMAVLVKKAAFKAFVVTDTIAMIFSSSAVIIHFLTQDFNRDRDMLDKHYTIAGLMLLIATTAMVLAFITGLYAVLAHSSALAISVCVIGSFFFLIYYYEFKSLLTFVTPS